MRFVLVSASDCVLYRTSTAEMRALLLDSAGAGDRLQLPSHFCFRSHKVLSTRKKQPMRGGTKKNKPKETKKTRGHLTWLFLEGKEVPCNNSTQSLNWLEHQGITGGILKYPDCRWIIMPLGRYEELHLSCLFSSSGSGSGSSVGSDLLIALWKILYHWNTTGDTIHRTEQKRNQDTASIDTMHYVQESDSWISMTQHGGL